jgi:hypothetical protein
MKEGEHVCHYRNLVMLCRYLLLGYDNYSPKSDTPRPDYRRGHILDISVIGTVRLRQQRAIWRCPKKYAVKDIHPSNALCYLSEGDGSLQSRDDWAWPIFVLPEKDPPPLGSKDPPPLLRSPATKGLSEEAGQEGPEREGPPALSPIDEAAFPGAEPDGLPNGAPAPAPSLPPLATDEQPAEASVVEEDDRTTAGVTAPSSQRGNTSSKAASTPAPRTGRRLRMTAPGPQEGLPLHELHRRLQEQRQPPTASSASAHDTLIGRSALCEWLNPKLPLPKSPAEGNVSAYYDPTRDGVKPWSELDRGTCSALDAKNTYWGQRWSRCERNCSQVGISHGRGATVDHLKLCFCRLPGLLWLVLQLSFWTLQVLSFPKRESHRAITHASNNLCLRAPLL